MSDSKLTALSALSPILSTDIIYVVSNPGGTPASKKVTVAQLFTSPALTTPALGVATATSINKLTLTAPATSAVLTIADGKTATHNATTTFAGTDGKTLTISNSGTLSGGDAFVLSIAAAKTLTVSNTLTLAGTDSTVMTFPTTSATIARTDAGQTFTGTQAFGAITASGIITQTSASATAFSSGPNGATNPVFQLVNSTASQADGVSITGLAAGSGVTFTALSSGSNASITLTPKGTADIFVPVSTGNTVKSITGIGTTSGVGIASTSVGLIIGNVRSAGLISTAFAFGSNVVAGFASTTDAFGASLDTGFARNAAGIIEVNNGTAGQWGALKSGIRDAGTTTVTSGLTIGHQTTNTAAAKFGAALAINANSSTTADQNQSLWYSGWQTATHASRRSFAGIQSVSNGIVLADRMIIGCTKTVGTNNAALTLCDIALATLKGCAGELVYRVFVSDGTNIQVRSGIIRYSAVNKAAAYTSEIVIVSEAASVSSGTLTATASITTGTNLITLNLTPNTSLTATTYYVEFTLNNLSESTVTPYTD